MRSRQRNSDGTKHKPTDAKTPRIKRIKKAGKTKKQIALKKSVTVKQRSEMQVMVAVKPSTARIKKNQRRTKSVLWVGPAQKIPSGYGSRSGWEFF